MASFRKLKSGYRAEIARKGVRMSKVFPTKQEAKDWAARAEYEILNGDKIAQKLRFGELLDRYAREVSPGKRGHRWEVIRLEKLGRDAVAQVSLQDLTAKHFAAWRDMRPAKVAMAISAAQTQRLRHSRRRLRK